MGGAYTENINNAIPGRTQCQEVVTAYNFITQDPANFIHPTSAKIGETFNITKAVGATFTSPATLFTCPSDITVRLVAFDVFATTSVGSNTTQLLNGTDAITAATNNATGGTRPVYTGIDPTYFDVAAGGTVKVACAGGASTPAVWASLTFVRLT